MNAPKRFDVRGGSALPSADWPNGSQSPPGEIVRLRDANGADLYVAAANVVCVREAEPPPTPTSQLLLSGGVRYIIPMDARALAELVWGEGVPPVDPPDLAEPAAPRSL